MKPTIAVAIVVACLVGTGLVVPTAAAAHPCLPERDPLCDHKTNDQELVQFMWYWECRVYSLLGFYCM